ncbi:protein Star isoform X1 [Harpegnathos saltator]|uniref:protein Star isoform X1 n=2 Tax=Harpegnathos saltator TaxID=610380 RepID=UPI00058E6EDF|nr:protein Star isoform X1 [Harpegnathos saltator]XP_025153424.1 protein Star isoform X1 [Harpegnathos saltator]
MEPVKAKMAPAGAPPSNGVLPPPIGSVMAGSSLASYKRTWWKGLAPCLAFLGAFSIAMALLLVWSEAAALRRQAFDANMTRDYVLDSVSMDNPQLVAYIRQVQLKSTTHQDPLNATQTSEEKYVATLSQSKREGVYAEYISRIGAISSTAWLEANLSWRGVLILTEPKSFFEAQRSTRNPRTRVLHACLSTDKDTKEIKYHQESEVQVTKLGDGPNSLVPSDDSLPTTRLKCFPLYSVLLAYNATTLDYLSLDSPDAPDGQVLDTIPWDIIRISVLSIRWSPHHSETETKSFIDKMTSRRYKLVHTTDTGKWIFLYNTLLKI